MDFSFPPNPITGDWNGSGCYINISTINIRNDTNMKNINDFIKKMGLDHSNWIHVYDGKNNELRLSGKHETSNIDTFTFGYGTRNTSVRIPNQTVSDGKGYLEDRRPGSDLDFYLTTSKYLDYLE